MTRFLARWLVTAVALAVAAWIFDGIRFLPRNADTFDLEHRIVPLLLAALIASAVTAFVKPVLTILSIPFIIVTLGLFLLVLNTLLLMFTAWLAKQLDIGFRVDGFWTAVGGSIVITLVTWLLDGFVPDERDRRREPAYR